MAFPICVQKRSEFVCTVWPGGLINAGHSGAAGRRWPAAGLQDSAGHTASTGPGETGLDPLDSALLTGDPSLTL